MEEETSLSSKNTKPRKTDASMARVHELLKAKDDTSRFVGLALLKAVLDNEDSKHGPARLESILEAISPKFLDRLLRAHSSQRLDKSEAMNMVDLAVSILHTFSTILPEESRSDDRLTGRIDDLVKAIVNSSPQTTKLILQTILTLVSQVEGAIVLLNIEDLSPLTELAAQHSLVLDVFYFAFTSPVSIEQEKFQRKINIVFTNLLLAFTNTDGVTLLNFYAKLLRQLPQETLPNNPPWFKAMVEMIHKLVRKRPTTAGRSAYTNLSATLLQLYPHTAPSLLFKSEIFSVPDSKPFSCLFINLLLINIQSSFPTLLSKLNDSSYPSLSNHLCSAFDILTSFISFLVRSLDEKTISPSSSATPLFIPASSLLKLRRDIAQTMSLTIEYLRDRFDASIAGTSGLHPSVRPATAVTSTGTHLTLTWDSMKQDLPSDPLVLATISTLALWTREDKNENLRHECAGLMDMFVELYRLSAASKLDFRYPILMALEEIMGSQDGIDLFLENAGWEALSIDLVAILAPSPDQLLAADSIRGIQIVRVLLLVIDDASIPSPQESWISLVSTIASLKVPTRNVLPEIIELYIAMLQLSSALLGKASIGLLKRQTTHHPAIKRLAKQLKILAGKTPNSKDVKEFDEMLEDVELDLENLNL